MANLSAKKGRDISVVLCGQAGQGIQTVEKLFTRILKANGYHVFATKEYMSRVRGGMNSTLIRISDKPVCAFIDRIDILVGLNKGTVKHLKKRITPETMIIGEMGVLGDEVENKNRLLDIPFSEIAANIGSKIYSNTVAVGALISMLSVKPEEVIDCLKQFFKDKSQEILEKNIEALKAGYEKAVNLENFSSIKIKAAAINEVKKQILVNGSEAVGLGAIAGGCNFISSYPMSPSTAVLVFLAQNSRDFGILAEQAEDEISAINMAIGAWYAGARAMVTTSGGGFALMTEGISLAGMLESPMVIHLAQRPGPATGLPTRTEQGDLELALYAGHGEFPRIIFAPGTLEDAFYLTQKAFNIADKFQIPVFILTDQYFIDSYYNTEPFNLKNCTVEKHFIETSENYRRYKLTEDGISPRGIPGFGRGLVCADSDEHDQEGHITEDLELRIKMVDKRLKKLDLIKQESIPPELLGPENYENLIICWGSTINIINEAVSNLGRKDTAVLYFKQVYPLHESANKLINKASKTIVVENNAAGQFARLLKIHADVNISHNILKYDGLCFASDSIAEKIKKLL
ncbi:MAG: 2-oxoacid:acceptor oxidoreductase subunit alpha [Sedimentisphaerales bacterium]|nr:2-oxoacid:acceptor oxidoreductase subunit alpha [Sedimentisphaerales bacterium]